MNNIKDALFGILCGAIASAILYIFVVGVFSVVFKNDNRVVNSPPSYTIHHGENLREVRIDGIDYIYNTEGGVVIKPKGKQ